MTSKPNPNNDQLPPESDRGPQEFTHVTAISRGSPQMQVARKESSSGFMLLSVKHLSKAKRGKNASVIATNGQKMHPLYEPFDDSCIDKFSSLERDYMGNKQNSFELGRHFSSTASLDAEEYDDDDEEDLGVASEHENFILHQNAAIGITQPGSSLVQSQPPNACRATLLDGFSNGHQTVDGVQPAVVSGLHPSQPVSIDELRFSTNAQIHASVAQSAYDLPSQPTSEHVYHQPNQTTVFRRLHSEVGSVTSNEPPIPLASHNLPSLIASSQQHSHHPDLSVAKHSDPSFDSCAPSAVTRSMFPLNQQNIYAGFPETATHRFVRELNEEHPRSASDAPVPPTLLSSLNAPVQPASRFRKARIRETVEQWGSNRLSFHDCRLKAVPDWVSYLQTKSVDTSFNHPVLHRGRCLYCFVPGSFGSKCLTHKHNQSYSSGMSLNEQYQLPSALPTVSASSDILHLLQAAFTAYHAYTLRGYNLSSLLTTWSSGQRASDQALIEHVERLSSNINYSLKVNGSSGPLPSEQIGMASHTAANNSTDVNEVISYSGGEGTSLEGITVVTGHYHHQQVASVDQPLASAKSPLKVNATNPEESAVPRVTDPSAAYLRHQLTCGVDGNSTGEAVLIDGRIPSTCSPVHQWPNTAVVDKQFVPPTSPATIGKATDVTQKPGADGVSVQLLRPFDNAGSTSIPETTTASAPHSPDTELSGPKIPRTVEPPSGQPLLPDSVLQDKQNVPGRLTFTQPGELGSPSTLGVSDHNGAEYISPLGPNTLLDNIIGGGQPSGLMSDPTVPIRSPHAAPVDLSAAASDIFQAAAAAVTVPAQPSSQPTGVACGTASGVGNLESQMPKCMDVIRLAIMETIQDQFSHLNSENEALRAAVNNLQHENHLLQSYKRAFLDLRRFFQPEVWEQIENHVRLAEAAFSEQAALHFFPQSPQQPLLGNSHQAQQNTSFQPPPPTAPPHQSPTHLPPDLQHLSPPTSDAVLPHTTMNNSQ